MFDKDLAVLGATKSAQAYTDVKLSDTVLLVIKGQVGHCFVERVGDTLVVAFEGTRPDHLEDWLIDFDAEPVLFPYGSGDVHQGFLDAFNELYQPLNDFITDHKCERILFTGHSLGGALAHIAATIYNQPNMYCYTFGQPRTGNAQFSGTLSKERYFRFVDDVDLVPRIPSGFGYYHGGTLVQFTPNGNVLLLNSEVGASFNLFRDIEDHSIEKYIRLVQEYADGKTA